MKHTYFTAHSDLAGCPVDKILAIVCTSRTVSQNRHSLNQSEQYRIQYVPVV
jgi:hypothetical protein